MTTNPSAHDNVERISSAALHSTRYDRWALVGLLAIILGNVAASWYWIQRNIVLIGNDASQYLQTTLDYAAFLSEITPQTIFQAFVYPPYRAPAIYIAAQPFMHLWGFDMDGAPLLNVVLLGVVVGITFLLARVWASSAAALMAAFLVGLFPMVAGMARLYYTEMFLTATVVIAMLALSQGRYLVSHTWAVILGVSFGVGLLVKWTMPVYVAAPLLWTLWVMHRRQPLASGSLRRMRVNFGALAIAVLIGVTFSAMWFLPNRQALQAYPLDDWNFAVWAFLFSTVVFAWRQPHSPLRNLALTLALMLAIASLWYGPHADIVMRLLEVDAERSQEIVGPIGTGNHLRYFRFIYEVHFGPFLFWVFAMPAALLWAGIAIRRRNLATDMAAIWLNIFSALIVLSLLGQANLRNLVPLLPFVAVLAVIGWWVLPRWPRTILAVIWVGAFLLQWSVITFDAAAAFIGEKSALWARSDYALPPASGETDYGYWIAPQILEQITAASELPQSLAVVVNTRQLHRGVLRYAASVGKHAVEFNDATGKTPNPWFNVLASQWVVVKDGDNRKLEDDGRTLVTRLFAGDPIFDALYQEAAQYLLPNGETVYLFHRAAGPGYPTTAPQRVEAAAIVADVIKAGWSGDATIVYANQELAVWVAMHDPPNQRFLILPDNQEEAISTLAQLRGTVFLVFDQATTYLHDFLAAHSYQAVTSGNDDIALDIIGVPTEPLTALAANGKWPPLQIKTISAITTALPGDVIPLEISFASDPPADWKISMRLLDAQGQVVASNDNALAPTLRAGLFVPADAPAGSYTVAVVIYDGLTLAPILNVKGNEQTMLFAVEVGAILN